MNKIIVKYWMFFLGLVVVINFATTITGKNLEFIPGDLGDARFNNYLLEHAHNYFIGAEDTFWDAPFMIPEENVITYSDNLLGTAPIYSTFRLSGFDVFTSFQLWFIVLFTLSYLTCFLFLKWYFKNSYVAVLGALLFTISIGLHSQISHAQMFPRFPIPLAFWFSLFFLRNLKPIFFFLTILTLVYQFYCGIYLGMMLFIPLVILLISIFIVKRFEILKLIKNWKWTLGILSSIFVSIGLLLPLMLPYYERSKLLVANSYESILISIPTLRSFLYVPKNGSFWSFLEDTGDIYPFSWGHQIFPGGIAIISLVFLFIYLLYSRYSKYLSIRIDTKLLVISCFMTFILFFRYQGSSLYQYLFNIPGFSSLRSLTRIINVELVFFAFALAFFTNILMLKYKKYTSVIFYIFLIFLVLDNSFDSSKSYRHSKSESMERVSNLVVKLKPLPNGAIFSYEPANIENPSHIYHIDAMLASQQLGLKTLNGYSSVAPYGYDKYWRELNEESRNFWLDNAKQIQDSIYIIH